MSRNIIVLTTGLAGSSLVTALFAQAGYWVGNETVQKTDYNTWENAELVKLNQHILEEVKFTENWTMRFQPEFIETVRTRALNLNPEPYLAFIKKCEQHSPWIWKDPRLWLTIRHWQTLMDLSEVQFVLSTRDPFQSWIAQILRRHIQTLSYVRKYEMDIGDNLRRFLNENAYRYVEVQYENLLLNPEFMLSRINELTGLFLTIDDLKKVAKGQLYRKRHGAVDLLKAVAIYIKNYRTCYR